MFKKKNEIVKAGTLSLSEERERLEKKYSPAKVTTESSSLPFGNFFNRKRTESFQRVVEARTGLLRALKINQMALDDLMTVDEDIAVQRIEKILRREIAMEELEEYRWNRTQRQRERE